MLAPYSNLSPIFFTAFFWVCLVITVIITCGANYGIDYWMHHNDPPPHSVANKSMPFEVLIFCIVIAFLVFFSAGDIQKRIATNDMRPVMQSALCDTLTKRILFFSMADPNWKMRILKFMGQCCLIPGIPIIVLIYLLCWMSSDFSSTDCSSSLTEMLLWTMVWKGVAAAVIYSANWAAVHNCEQPEIEAIAEKLGQTTSIVNAPDHIDLLTANRQSEQPEKGAPV